MNAYLENIGKQAKTAAKKLAFMKSGEKDRIIKAMADALVANSSCILEKNALDLENAKNSDMKTAFIDRLTLTKPRIDDMAKGLHELCALPDPIGEMKSMTTRPNGLKIGKITVPLGVVGFIYEARPNVTADAAGICLKSGNAVILRGGKEAINSNTAITEIMSNCIKKSGYDNNMIQLITDTSRETANEFMRMNQYVDVLIPRGGAGLINAVMENSNIPVIQTGVGNCHIFVDETADLQAACDIVINAKTSRPGVCNACEKLLVHKNISEKFIPLICDKLRAYNVEIRGDEICIKLADGVLLAGEDDWNEEYLDLIIAIKVAGGIDEAIDHINSFTTGHSEAIITDSYSNSQKFLSEIDAAAVYVNASTRFTDGGQFGMGAELGISTQKLHARGPMGVSELTSSKFIIYGSGQTR